MVGLALTYFFIYVVRQGVTSWFVFYLLQVTPVCVALFSGLLHGCVFQVGLLAALASGCARRSGPTAVFCYALGA